MFALRKEFGARVRELREKLSATTREFAETRAIDHLRWRSIEAGTLSIKRSDVNWIAAALNVDPQELFAGTGEKLTVPYADDDTFFHPGMRRTRSGGYQVGSKADDEELLFDSFDEALEHLRSMKVAHWRRPNLDGSGQWGDKKAVRWGELPLQYAWEPDD